MEWNLHKQGKGPPTLFFIKIGSPQTAILWMGVLSDRLLGETHNKYMATNGVVHSTGEDGILGGQPLYWIVIQHGKWWSTPREKNYLTDQWRMLWSLKVEIKSCGSTKSKYNSTWNFLVIIQPCYICTKV